MKMKKLLAIILCVILAAGILPGAAIADAWEESVPTISVEASELQEDGRITATVHVELPDDNMMIMAFGLGMEYDSSLVDVDYDSGNYLEDGYPVGVGFSDNFPVPQSLPWNDNRLDAADGEKKIYFIAQSSQNGFVSESFDVYFYFKLKEGAPGGAAVFTLTNESTTEADLFQLVGQKLEEQTDPRTGRVKKVPVEPKYLAAYPKENNSATVAIPFTSIPVSGELAIPSKGGTDDSNLTSSSDFVNVNVEWIPALADGVDESGAPVKKFEADTEYTAKVFVYAVGGAVFTGEEEIVYDGKSGLEFQPALNGDEVWIFVAIQPFKKTDPKEITAMEITTRPTKLSGYVDGDTFSTDGMKVKATYDDKSVEEDYKNYTVTPATLKKGNTVVTVTSNEKASLKETVTLTEAVAGRTEGFAAEFSPDKLELEYTGDDLTGDFEGLISAEGITGDVDYTFKSGSVVMKAVVDVGTYDVYASVTGDDHYADISEVLIATAEVTKMTVEPSIGDIGDQEYTGQAIEPTITVNCTPALTAETDYTVEFDQNIDAGTATVTLKSVDTSNYTFEDVEATFTITPKSTAVSWDDLALTYQEGVEQAPTATAAGVDGETLNLTVNGGATDAGEYTAEAEIASVSGGRENAANYTLTGASADYTIGKADYTGELPEGAATAPAKGAEDREFDITSLGLPESFKDAKVVSAAPAAEAGIVTAAAKGSDTTVKFSTSAAEDGDPGVFTVVISSRNWNDVAVTVNVTARALELPEGFWDEYVAVAESVEYGTKDSEVVTFPKGVSVSIPDPEGNPVSGTLSLNEDIVRNVGDAETNKVTVTANFDGTIFTETFGYEVTAREAAVVWADTEQEYNGTTLEPTASAEGVNGETLVLAVVVTGDGDGIAAGAYTASAELTSVTGGNASADNYILTNETADFTIAKKAVTVSGITAANKTYDGTTDAELDFSAAVIDGKLDSDDLSVTATGAFADADAGKGKTVTISGLTLTGAAEDNYTLAAEGQQSSATADIDPKVVTFDVTLEKTSVEYNGAEQAPAVTVKDGSTVLTADKDYTVTVNPAVCKDAGEYTVTVAGAGNYAGSTAADQTYTITPKALSDAMVSGLEDQTYSGKAIEPVTLKDGDTELKVGTDYTITYASNTDAGTASVTVTGAGNYSGTLNKTFSILPLEVAVTWTNTDLTYTGKALAPTAEAAGVDGETLNLTVSGEQTDAGDYTASAALTSVDGGQARAENYKLTGETVSFTIKAAAFTGTVAITADADPIVEGTTLTADVSGATGDTLTYQWSRDGAAIDGATANTYKVTGDDVGAKITVAVASSGNYEGELSSEAVTPLGPPSIISVEASGEGETMTVSWEVEDNGAPISEITVTVSREGNPDIVVTAKGSDTGVEIPNLVEGQTYTVKVKVTNDLGSTVSDELTVEMEVTAVDEDPSDSKDDEKTLYTVTVQKTENGKAEVSVTKGYEEDIVNIKITPDEGYELDTLTVVTDAGKNVKVTENKGRYSFYMPKANVTVKATFKSTAPEETEEPGKADMPFVDVEAGSVYEDAVYWALEKGITTGTTETTFSPYLSCTRAEAVTFLWRASGCPEPKTRVSPFTDVQDAGAYYYKAVLWAYEKGITTGVSSTEFSPFTTLTRAQMVTFIYRMSGENASTADMPFTDVAPNAYYAEAVVWAVGKGVTKGTTAITFSPDDQCVRYQVVTFLYRMFK